MKHESAPAPSSDQEKPNQEAKQDSVQQDSGATEGEASYENTASEMPGVPSADDVQTEVEKRG